MTNQPGGNFGRSVPVLVIMKGIERVPSSSYINWLYVNYQTFQIYSQNQCMLIGLLMYVHEYFQFWFSWPFHVWEAIKQRSLFFSVRGTNTFLHASFFSCIISVFERVVWEIRYVLEEKKYICLYEVQTPLHGWSCSISAFVRPGKVWNSSGVTSRIFTQIFHSTTL